MVKMGQRYFTENWILPCSLRSNRTANSKPKNGVAIFRLDPPTTLRQENEQEIAAVNFS